MASHNWYLIVGLGNPGRAYVQTRHNVGFMVVDQLAATYAVALETKKRLPDVAFGRGVVEGVDVVLAKPLAFMNQSGPPVENLARYFNLSSEAMLVIHDDIDLAFGRLKIIAKGGHGGHKGVKSLTEAFGGSAFARLRIGIGRSEDRRGVVDHVLGKFSSTEQQCLEQIIARARDAAVTLLCKGAKASMNMHNRKQITNNI